MKKKSNSLKKSFEKGQGKNTSFQSQEKTIFQYLKKHTATTTMLTAATGIPQKCITRYKRELEKEGKLQEVVKAICKSSGFKAYYLTTNTSLFKKNYLKR